MTRNEYLVALEKELRQLPKQDFQEAMEYFTEYFDEAGQENEADLIAELGTPQEAAADIIQNVLGKESPIERFKRSRSPKEIALWIFLIILASPLLLAIGATVFSVALGVLGTVISIIIALASILLAGYLLSVCSVIVGFMTLGESIMLFSNSWSALLMGIGGFFTAVGLGVLGFLASLYLSKLFGRGMMAFGHWVNKLWNNRRWGKRHEI